MHLPQPDWLHHRLTVEGEKSEVSRFADEVRGPGIVLWDIDYDRLQEDWFYRLMASQAGQPARHRLSPAAARRLAARLREAVWAAWEAPPPPDRPLDLNAVTPVPAAVLARGFGHPEAIDWMWQHWGTTWPLRHVRRRGGDDHTFGCEFFSADWTPWPALATLRSRFPALSFTVKVTYG